jgi:hypothetical protein
MHAAFAPIVTILAVGRQRVEGEELCLVVMVCASAGR